MKELTKAEETLLITILGLGEDAYGVAVKQHLQKKTGKALPYGTLYFILDQLTKKGYVKRSTGEDLPERGGRGRIYYTLTSRGKAALQQAYAMNQKVWKGYADLSLKEKKSG